MRGAEQFQRGVSGDEFHHRSGVQRLLRAVHGHRFRRADFMHVEADAGFGDARAGERLGHWRGQLRLSDAIQKYQ